MSIPPLRNSTAETPQYPSPWTTKRPREGLRDNVSARIVSLSPDVCKTPIGSAIPPIPYPIIDYCGHNSLYTESVLFTSQKAMVMRSHTTHVHGDKPGTACGVKSGTVESICEPIGHAAQVRAEGSQVIRHLDRFLMNSGNAPGEALFIRDTSLYSAPVDTDPIPGSLAFAALEHSTLPGSISNPQVLPPGSYQVAQMAGNSVVDAGGGLFGGQATRGGTATVAGPAGSSASQVKTPTFRQRGLLGMWVWIADQITSGGVSEAQINTILAKLDDFATNPATGAPADQRAVWAAAAAEIRATALPAKDVALAEEIDQRAYNQVIAMADGTDKEEVDEQEDSKTVRVSGKLTICFDLPPDMDRDEFERQLKEQQTEINKMTADDMAYAQWVIEKAGTTKFIRDYAAQRAARRQYARELARQGLSESKIEEALKLVNATHYLDIIAGGDPSNVGIGRADANQEIGRQWIRDNRVKALKEEAQKMRDEGRSQDNMDVELVICS